MKCLLHIQDATGKEKIAPDRSGNAMVSPENILFHSNDVGEKVGAVYERSL